MCRELGGWCENYHKYFLEYNIWNIFRLNKISHIFIRRVKIVLQCSSPAHIRQSQSSEHLLFSHILRETAKEQKLFVFIIYCLTHRHSVKSLNETRKFLKRVCTKFSYFLPQNWHKLQHVSNRQEWRRVGGAVQHIMIRFCVEAMKTHEN